MNTQDHGKSEIILHCRHVKLNVSAHKSYFAYRKATK